MVWVRVIFGCLSLCYLIALLYSHYLGYRSRFGTGSGMGYVFPAMLGLPWTFFSMTLTLLVWGDIPREGIQQKLVFFLNFVMPGLINLALLMVPLFYGLNSRSRSQRHSQSLNSSE